jgi:predicted amidohydrolase
MNKPIKIACLQYHAVPKEYEKNKEQVAKLLEQVGEEKPDIILLPELSFNGHYYTKDKNDLSEQIMGETFQFLKHYSEKLDALIVGGINEKIPGSGLCYSTSLIVDRGNLVGSYRKQNPPSVERVFVKPSEDNNNIFKTRFGNIMLLTCYDTSFIHSYEKAFSEEVDFILVSNAWLKMEKMPFVNVEKYEHHTVLPRAIAMQTRCPVAVANMVGPTRIIVPSFPMYGGQIMDFETEFSGNSFICDHMGDVIKIMDDTSTGYICGTINTTMANEMKKITIDNYGIEQMKAYIEA